MAVKRCRCGQRQKELPCNKDYQCETKCPKVKDCHRHPCKRKVRLTLCIFLVQIMLSECPRRSYKVLKCLIFSFPFIRLLERSYFFLGILDQRSYKGIISNTTDFFSSKFRITFLLKAFLNFPELANLCISI